MRRETADPAPFCRNRNREQHLSPHGAALFGRERQYEEGGVGGSEPPVCGKILLKMEKSHDISMKSKEIPE